MRTAFIVATGGVVSILGSIFSVRKEIIIQNVVVSMF